MAMKCQWMAYWLWIITLGVLTSASQPSTCPNNCRCTSSNVTCTNGFAIETSNFKFLSPMLQHISFEDFYIRELPADIFRPFKRINTLKVLDCRLRTVSENSFAGLTSLQDLNLEHNHIDQLPLNVFSDLQSLSVLNLGYNLIEFLPKHIFSNLSQSLNVLKLNNNRLRLLEVSLFDKLIHLQHLNLSNNELSFIHPRTFSFLHSIKLIDLNDNLLVTINEDLFDGNNQTIKTDISLLRNPLLCNCGLKWLREALLGNIPSIELVNSTDVICDSPHIYHGRPLNLVLLEHLNCTEPEAAITKLETVHFYKSKLRLECHVDGDPYPSVIWKTPMGDLISDPYHGQWLDNSINQSYPEKVYKIYATGETIAFKTLWMQGYSYLEVSGMHRLASGEYTCIVINPGGKISHTIDVKMASAIDNQYLSSLFFGGIVVLCVSVVGIVGCSVIQCIDRCAGCQPAMIKYYDGDIMAAQQASAEGEDIPDCEKINAVCGVEVDGNISQNGYEDYECSSPSIHCGDINEQTTMTAEEWDAYFKEYPDDFVIECLSQSPRKSGSLKGSPRGSPTHRAHHGKTLETLEGVRLKLKLRVEQIDVMRERLRIRMEKRGARMKDNMAKHKIKMNERMQAIKESTSQSLQTIKETGRNYSHKLHMGVRYAMENVGAHVQSLKEFCGTGDLGQTLSIATITTDVDTSEVSELRRSITMV